MCLPKQKQQDIWRAVVKKNCWNKILLQVLKCEFERFYFILAPPFLRRDEVVSSMFGPLTNPTSPFVLQMRHWLMEATWMALMKPLLMPDCREVCQRVCPVASWHSVISAALLVLLKTHRIPVFFQSTQWTILNTVYLEPVQEQRSPHNGKLFLRVHPFPPLFFPST